MRMLASLLFALPAPAVAATPTASSVGTSMEGTRHTAARAFDGLLSTAWSEGAMGDGEGEWLEIRFDRPVDVASVSVWPGWLGGMNREVREYGRPRTVTLSFGVGRGEPVVKQEVMLDPGAEGPLRHDVLVEVSQARSLRITLDEVYGGGIHSDTFIAEVALNLVAGEPVSQVEAVGSWLSSDAGQRVAAAHHDRAVGLYDKIQAEQFGDRDSLQQLMDWAIDGAPHVRERARSRVPAGFRVAAIQPDETALKALLKVKDANAVSAIERAALRTTGSLSAELARRADMLAAYAEIKGGGARNIPPWGQEGFEKGALRSLGEPLPLAIDSNGGVFVADLGNHRVQRFDLDTGIVDETWGAPEADLTEIWFYKTRDFYASGAAPSTAPGGFVHPVDLSVRRGKDGDSVFVLDLGAEPGHKGSWGRITHIDPAGQIAHTQPLPFDGPISANVSGEGHIVTTKKHVIVLWANEGITYTLPDWEPSETFRLEDGAPEGAVAFGNGKLGLVYGRELVLYSTDGFRHGDVIGDSLGPGYESWGLTLDERGKLWAALDTGEIVKFKRPGKVDFRFTLGDYSFVEPRIAVLDDHVFVTTRDQILRGDALQLYAEQSTGESRENLDLGISP